MIVLPEKKVIVVATPRTGSRSLNEAILEGAANNRIRANATALHHDFPHDVIRAAADKYEIWAMTREPLSQLKSWISHCQMWHEEELNDWLRTYNSRFFRYEGGMNIYGKTATRFFIYEDGGHQLILDELRISKGVEIPLIGSTGSELKTLTQEQLSIVHKRFKYDFEFYDRIGREYHG